MKDPQPFLFNNIVTFQLFKYAIMGVSNTVLDFSVYFLLTRFSIFFGTQIFIAKAISFIVAATWSFYGNKRWTFKSSNRNGSKKVLKYYITAGTNGAVNVTTHYVVVGLIGLPDTIGIVIAAGVTLLFGFILNKWWVFVD